MYDDIRPHMIEMMPAVTLAAGSISPHANRKKANACRANSIECARDILSAGKSTAAVYTPHIPKRLQIATDPEDCNRDTSAMTATSPKDR